MDRNANKIVLVTQKSRLQELAKAMHASIDEHKYDFETIELAVYCPLRDTSNYEVFAKEFSA